MIEAGRMGLEPATGTEPERRAEKGERTPTGAGVGSAGAQGGNCVTEPKTLKE